MTDKEKKYLSDVLNLISTKEKTKTFDAVKIMRDARDKISEETQIMTLEQLKKYIADKIQQSNLRAIGR